jgi:hypothetical protein
MELLRKNWTWLGWRLSRRGADGVFLEKKFFEPPTRGKILPTPMYPIQ